MIIRSRARWAKAARIVASAGIAAGATIAVPAAASSASADYFRARSTHNEVPTLLGEDERAFYLALFSAIDGRDWVRVDGMLAQRSDGLLHQVARAQYYLDVASPRVELPAIEQWLAQGTQLPQADQMVRLGQKRGLAWLPGLPAERSLVSTGSSPKRILPRAVDDGTMPGDLKAAILDRIKGDDPDGARQLLDGVDATLSSEARAEWRQRIAWSYYIENQDAPAFALAQTVKDGSGAWVAEGDWTAGLAAWRLGDCAAAATNFTRATRGADNAELAAAAHYWAARSLVRCRQPEQATEQLRGAARYDETLYGMLAVEQLGRAMPRAAMAPDFSAADWQALRGEPNVRTAVALAEVGRAGLADEVLRHQARIGAPQHYQALGRLARELGLPSTQLWMAYHTPVGGVAEPALRYPAPRWQPVTGWKVDPALAYAHALQESNFRATAVSPAEARGLMQITPITVRQHAGRLGLSASAVDIFDPGVNLAFGQQNLEMLRDSPATGGLLPKIMAAYNAGLSPIGRWNTEVRDQGDPLLYMESIPYWETRGYVAIVTRNYWMYERQAGGASESRTALVQNAWPTFPELAGGNGIRVTPTGRIPLGRVARGD